MEGTADRFCEPLYLKTRVCVTVNAAHAVHPGWHGRVDQRMLLIFRNPYRCSKVYQSMFAIPVSRRLDTDNGFIPFSGVLSCRRFHSKDALGPSHEELPNFGASDC
jgi:hypothetical protein